MAGPEDFENRPLKSFDRSFCPPGYTIAIHPVVDRTDVLFPTLVNTFSLRTPQGEVIKCSHLVLATRSESFRQLLKSLPDLRSSPPYLLPIDPGSRFQSVLAAFSGRPLRFTLDSIVDFLVIAEQCKIDLLQRITDDQFNCAMAVISRDPKAVLRFCHSLVKSQLPAYATRLGSLISVELSNRLRNPSPHRPIRSVLECLSAEVLRNVLSQPQLAGLSEDEKIQLADDFASLQTLTPEDKDRLSDCILTWNRPDCIRTLHPEQTLVLFRCDWVSPKYCRRYLKLALDIRRANLSAMVSKCKHGSSSVSRWYVLRWLSVIHSAESWEKSPTVHAVESVGISDISSFGIMQTTSSRPISQAFAAKFCLMKGDSYFVSCSNPWIELDFGPRADFRVTTILINSPCRVPRTLKVEIELATGIRESIGAFSVQENRIQLDAKVNCRKLRLVQQVPPEYRVNVMRIKSLDVVGRFRR
jgi:hypothetical protein